MWGKCARSGSRGNGGSPFKNKGFVGAGVWEKKAPGKRSSGLRKGSSGMLSQSRIRGGNLVLNTGRLEVQKEVLGSV